MKECCKKIYVDTLEEVITFVKDKRPHSLSAIVGFLKHAINIISIQEEVEKCDKIIDDYTNRERGGSSGGGSYGDNKKINLCCHKSVIEDLKSNIYFLMYTPTDSISVIIKSFELKLSVMEGYFNKLVKDEENN